MMAQDEARLELEIRSIRSPTWLLRPLDDNVVTELARSIEGVGLLQPIAVRRVKIGYEVVFGHHRLQACKILGRSRIDCTVRNFSDEEAFLARVSENLLRNTYVNPVEEASGYKTLLDKGWTIHAIGKKIGKSDGYVCERLGLLDRLDTDIARKMSTGKTNLTTSHVELLSKIHDPVEQRRLAELIEKRRLSVRTLESILNGIPSAKRIPVESHLGKCLICIPDDFAKAIGLTAGKTVRILVRGKKLVIESDSTTRKRVRHPLPCIVAETIA